MSSYEDLKMRMTREMEELIRVRQEREERIKSGKINIGIAYPAFKHLFEISLGQEIKDLSTARRSEVEACDLIIFSGGEDISPEVYHSTNTYSIFNSERDYIEIEIYNISKQAGKKMFGVCRGHQLLNALDGGILIQDLLFEGKITHPSPHPISYLESSEILQGFSIVNSIHHQGVVRHGRSFIPISFYEKTYRGERIFESCEASDMITVQFHPEMMHNNESRDFFNKLKTWALSPINKTSIRKRNLGTYTIEYDATTVDATNTQDNFIQEENNIPGVAQFLTPDPPLWEPAMADEPEEDEQDGWVGPDDDRF